MWSNFFPFKMLWSCNKNNVVECQLQYLHQKIGSFQVKNTNVISAAENHSPPTEMWSTFELEIVRNRTASFSCRNPVQIKRSGDVQLPPPITSSIATIAQSLLSLLNRSCIWKPKFAKTGQMKEGGHVLKALWAT